MTKIPIRTAGSGRRVSVAASNARVVARVDGVIIADTMSALTVHDVARPPTQYIPRQDVDMSVLRRASFTTVCPRKGVAVWFDILLGNGSLFSVAAWTYEFPHPPVEAIAGHIAFSERDVCVEEWERNCPAS